MDCIQIHDLTFRPFLSEALIRERIREMALALTRRYQDKRPVFLCVLNGSFIFAADLARACAFECEWSFIKLSSYQGLSSGGEVKTLIGLEADLRGRHLVVVEDIIDSGKTMSEFIPFLNAMEPASVAIATLLVKPDAIEYPVSIDFRCFDIPGSFVVGYGLDYDGLGRNLPGIYQLASS